MLLLPVIRQMSFVGKGIKLAFDLVNQTSKYKKCQLGQEFRPSEELLHVCEESVCAMYEKPGSSINEVRCDRFSSRNFECYQIPPTKDALNKDIARASYQASIWRRTLVCNPQVPSPVSHGWVFKDDDLCVDWMSHL